MKTIYISGSITDLSTGQPREDWQRDFLGAEQKLRRMGFSVINPVDIAREVEEEWRQQWSLPGGMTEWSDPVSARMMEHGPTRGTYIAACLERMNDEALAGRLHGVYLIGRGHVPVRSHGVRMEVLMAEVLGIPVYAEHHGDRRIGATYLPVGDQTIGELLDT